MKMHGLIKKAFTKAYGTPLYYRAKEELTDVAKKRGDAGVEKIEEIDTIWDQTSKFCKCMESK